VRHAVAIRRFVAPASGCEVELSPGPSMTPLRGLAIALLVIALVSLFLTDNIKTTIVLVILGNLVGFADMRRAKKH
jgi:hypothetical protein